MAHGGHENGSQGFSLSILVVIDLKSSLKKKINLKALFEYDEKISKKKEKLTNRLLGKLAKAQDRFLVMKDRNSNGLITNYLLDDLINVSCTS